MEGVNRVVRRKFIKVTRATLICSAVAASLSVMGVGYASWNRSVTAVSKISTGSIDLIFNDAYFCNNLSIEGNFNEANDNETNFIEINIKDNSNGDIVHVENIISNDVSLEVDYNTILISGIMYYPNDIVLKYNVANEGTIPVQMINEDQEKYEFENGSFINIDHNSGTIIIHIPRVEGDYYATVPIEFKSKYGSWNETLYIDLNVSVELPNNQVTSASVISMGVTTSSAISMEVSQDSNAQPGKEVEVNVQHPVEVIKTETEKILEALDKLSSAIIVESKINNEVDNQ